MRVLSKPLLTAISVGLALSFSMTAFARPMAGQPGNDQESAESRPVKIAVMPASALQMATSDPEKPEASKTPASEQAYRTQLVQKFILDYNKKLSYEQARTFAEAIMEFSERYHVDFRLVTGVIAVESSFRADAISSSGAIGLGQLKPDTAKWLGVVNPYDPIDNIAGTTRFLSWLLRKYNGNLDQAVSAYYQGPGSVDRQGISADSKYYLGKVNKVLGMMF